jgi:hypothetical protein
LTLNEGFDDQPVGYASVVEVARHLSEQRIAVFRRAKIHFELILVISFH